MAKVPFPYIDGLPQRAREQIYRDFESIPEFTGAGAFGEFDAEVDNSLAASNPPKNAFKSIHEAINHYGSAPGGSRTTIRLLVRFSDSVYSETLTMNRGSLLSIYVYGEGAPDFDSLMPDRASSTLRGLPIWSVGATNAFIGGTVEATTLVIEGMAVTASVTLTAGQGLFRGIKSLMAVKCSLATGAPQRLFDTTAGLAVKKFYAINCFIADLDSQAGDGPHNWSIYDSTIEVRGVNTKSWAHNLLMSGCNLTWGDTMTITLPGTICRITDCFFARDGFSSFGSIGRLTFSVTGGSSQTVNITGSGPRLAGFLDVTVTSRNRFFLYDVGENDGTVIVPAPGTPESTPPNVVIRGQVGRLDVAGPALVDVAVTLASDLAVQLRGGRIRANLSMYGNSGDITAPPTVLLSTVGLTDSNIDVASSATGTGTQVQPYNLDAASLRNFLDWAGASTFPIAGVNAGGATNIIRVT